MHTRYALCQLRGSTRMARHKKRNRIEEAGRPNPVPSRRLRSSPLVSPAERSLINLTLDLEDRREFHPEGVHRPARGLPKLSADLVAPNLPARKRSGASVFRVPKVLSFRVPKRVSLCVRRHQRREVLFAIKKTGRGSRARFHKFNKWSLVRC